MSRVLWVEECMHGLRPHSTVQYSTIQYSTVSFRPPTPHTQRPQAYLEAGHGEQEVWVVLGVDGDEGVVPVKGGEGAGQPVLHIPKDGAAQVDVVLHQAHARIPRPAPAKGGGGAEAGGRRMG
jgi:hypothetical protein